jgi:hypothetical protein
MLPTRAERWRGRGACARLSWMTASPASLDQVPGRMAKNLTATLIGIAALICASTTWARGPELRPGLWKFSETTQAVATEPPHTFQRCLTPSDVKNFGDNFIPAQGQRLTDKVRCEVTAFSETRSAINWTYRCAGESNLISVGSINFDSPSHYSGIIKTSGTMSGSLLIEGTRIGSCPSE